MRLLFFTIIFQILLFADYPTLYSHDNKSFSDSSYNKVELLGGIKKYSIGYISSNDLPVSNRKIFIPPFVTEIRTTAPVYGGGSNASADAYVALGKLPDHNNLTTIEDYQTYSKFELMLQGKTYRLFPDQTIKIADVIPKSLYSVQSNLGKWLYIEMIKTEPNANFIDQFGISLWLDIPLVDEYVASKNYPADSDCDSKAERKNICYFVKNIENDIQTPQVDKPKIDENTPQSKSIKACEVGSYDFNATGGSGGYTWSSTNTNAGIIDSSTGVLPYKTDAVGEFSTNITATDTSSSSVASDPFSFTLTVDKNATLKTIPAQSISNGATFSKNFQDSIDCNATNNTITKWTLTVKDSSNQTTIPLNTTQFNPSTGTINWEPPSGTYNLSLTADNEKGQTDTKAFNLTVSNPEPVKFKDSNTTITFPVGTQKEIDLKALLSQGSDPITWVRSIVSSSSELSESDIKSKIQLDQSAHKMTINQLPTGTYKISINGSNIVQNNTSCPGGYCNASMILNLNVIGVRINTHPKQIYIATDKSGSYDFNVSMPYTSAYWTMANKNSDTLPSGLTFNDKTGVMSWSSNLPLQTYYFRIMVKDNQFATELAQAGKETDLAIDQSDFNVTVFTAPKIQSIAIENTGAQPSTDNLAVKGKSKLRVLLKDGTDKNQTIEKIWSVLTKSDNTLATPDINLTSKVSQSSEGNYTISLNDLNISESEYDINTSVRRLSREDHKIKSIKVVDENYSNIIVKNSLNQDIINDYNTIIDKDENLSVTYEYVGTKLATSITSPTPNAIKLNDTNTSIELNTTNEAKYDINIALGKSGTLNYKDKNITIHVFKKPKIASIGLDSNVSASPSNYLIHKSSDTNLTITLSQGSKNPITWKVILKNNGGATSERKTLTKINNKYSTPFPKESGEYVVDINASNMAGYDFVGKQKFLVVKDKNFTMLLNKDMTKIKNEYIAIEGQAKTLEFTPLGFGNINDCTLISDTNNFTISNKCNVEIPANLTSGIYSFTINFTTSEDGNFSKSISVKVIKPTIAPIIMYLLS